MKDRRKIPAGTPNGVCRIVAKHMKGAKNAPNPRTSQGL